MLGTCESHVNPKTPHIYDRFACHNWREMDWPVLGQGSPMNDERTAEIMERVMYQWWCFVCHKWVGTPRETTYDVPDHIISRHLGGHMVREAHHGTE